MKTTKGKKKGYDAAPELEEVPTFHPRPDTINFVRNFEAAVRRHEERNSFDPAEWEEIDGAYAGAKRELYHYLIGLEMEGDLP